MLSAHPDLVVLWVDAHGDINTPESSPSRLYHGRIKHDIERHVDVSLY